MRKQCLRNMIWRKDKEEKVTYYNHMSKEQIEKKYTPIYYRILYINSQNIEWYSEKEIGKIYAIYTHPVISRGDLREKDFVLPGVPLLIEIKNHKIINYYFDDMELLDFLDSSKSPLDDYWNI